MASPNRGAASGPAGTGTGTGTGTGAGAAATAGEAALLAARGRVAADPRDAGAWSALAGALAALREPEAAYTAAGRGLLALEGRPDPGRLAPPLAAQRLDALAAIARGGSSAVGRRLAASGLLRPPPGPSAAAASGVAAAGAAAQAAAAAGGVGGQGGGAKEPGGGVRVFVLSDLHVDTPAYGAPAGVRSHMDLLGRICRTRFRGDVLLVAGDVADSLPATVAALRLLRERFGRVFYVPGNHCLWLRPGLEAPSGAPAPAPSDRGPSPPPPPDSFAKLWALQARCAAARASPSAACCDDLGVDTAPSPVAPGLLVAPLLSWYSHRFDERDPRPGRLRFDRFCTWPVREEDVWQARGVMLRLNDPALAAAAAWRKAQQQQQGGERGGRGQASGQEEDPSPAGPSDLPPAPPQDGQRSPSTGLSAARSAPVGGSDGAGEGSSGGGGGGGGRCGLVVVTMSHFLPHPGLPFAPGVPELAKAVGCRRVRGSRVGRGGVGELMYLLDRLDSAVHVYGHTHIAADVELAAPPPAVGGGGAAAAAAAAAAGAAPSPSQQRRRRYVHWPLQGRGRVVLRCIWREGGLCGEDVDAEGEAEGA
ncbi:hypothetical protein HYH03_000501 [Edaphochlamys debaryana]|uniref:Calcineurin-like phosphoesterase domain-containing protein n=1 Tax=Edaphochlamys debaryana TaxID=47281 RepID=A0A835YFS9_9CHLO|nr:hypothetical protein HYH03_000501 [Edaphochlamys debaryana]|eukprot:KAG2502005.1 hypothetical protein HYH03_000501 [Edaphochlamys debaryana]